MSSAEPAPRPASLPTTGPSRLVALDALRALAVLLVIGRHLRLPYSLPASSPTRTFAELWQRGGWIGVDLFFVLSGFLVSGLLFREHQQYGRISLGRFFVRRGFKIYPAFYVFLAVTIALRLAWGRHLDWSQILAELFFVQNYVHGVWNHTWSLAVEEHFYILLPLLLLGLLYRARKQQEPFRILPMICGGLMLALLGLRIWNAVQRPFDTATHVFPTHLRIDSLMFGVLLSYWFHYRRVELAEMARRHLGAMALLGLTLLIPPFIFPLDQSIGMYTIGYSGLAIGSGLLLTAALHAPAGLDRWLAPAARIGAYSYSIYLWHLPVLGYWMTWLQNTIGHQFSWIPRTLIGVTACIVFGIGVSQLIEYRVLRFRDRHFPSRSQAMKSPLSAPPRELVPQSLPVLTD